MYIGKLAELSGATRKAIRLYESLGLIPIPNRRGKYRVYSDQYVDMIKMIRRAQSVGFKLSELKAIITEKAETSEFPIEMANELIVKKREALRKEMDEILSRDRRLVELQDELKRIFG